MLVALALALGAFFSGMAYKAHSPLDQQKYLTAIADIERLALTNKTLEAKIAKLTNSVSAPIMADSKRAVTSDGNETPDLSALVSKPEMFAGFQRQWFAKNPAPIGRKIFSINSDVSAASIDALKMQPSEAQGIKLALEAAKERYRKQLGDSAKLVYEADNELKIVIPASFSAADVYTKLAEDFTAILGAERAEGLLEMGFGDLNAQFAYFGGGDRTITMKGDSMNNLAVIRLLDSPSVPPGVNGYINAARTWTFRPNDGYPPQFDWLDYYRDQLVKLAPKK